VPIRSARASAACCPHRHFCPSASHSCALSSASIVSPSMTMARQVTPLLMIDALGQRSGIRTNS
jgi:hypothetical protein